MNTSAHIHTDEDLCYACDGPNAEHTCGYVNEDCPEQCAMEHEMDTECISQCPDTGNWWRFCAICGWEPVTRYAPDPTYIPDVGYLCHPWDHGWSDCYGCGSWVLEDDLRYSEGDDTYYCDACYQERRGGTEGEPANLAPCCGSLNVHLDLYSESFVCDCRAAAAMATHGAVELAHALSVAA